MQLAKRELLSSEKFLTRWKDADNLVSYSIGYSYHSERHGVHCQLKDTDNKSFFLRFTPEQAEQFANQLLEWAGKAREYQKTV
jgi:hypothetical protein